MKGNYLKVLAVSLMMMTVMTSCNNEDNEPLEWIEISYEGIWTGAQANVVLTEDTWEALVGSSTDDRITIYNSGTFDYKGDLTAVLTVKNKGMGSASVGEKGKATFSKVDGQMKMVISGLSDTNMNGSYSYAY